MHLHLKKEIRTKKAHRPKSVSNLFDGGIFLLNDLL